MKAISLVFALLCGCGLYAGDDAQPPDAGSPADSEQVDGVAPLPSCLEVCHGAGWTCGPGDLWPSGCACDVASVHVACTPRG